MGWPVDWDSRVKPVGHLTGGACLLGLYAGKGAPAEEENLRLNFMIEDLVKWFKAGYGQEYGGIRCEDNLSGVPNAVASDALPDDGGRDVPKSERAPG